MFLTETESKLRGPLLSLLFNIILEVSAIRQKKRNQRHLDWKGKIILSLFEDDMVLYIENPKEFFKTPLEVIKNFSKVVRYMINIKK